MTATVFKPNQKLSIRPSVFLAGSIEMDTAERWQDAVEEALECLSVDIYNPRRDDWDSSWKQSITDHNFVDQVNWELNALEKATLIFMYFDPKTYSPISLLELGLYARTGKLIVVCPDGFWRKGNVDIVCTRYGIPTFPDMKSGLDYLKNILSIYPR